MFGPIAFFVRIMKHLIVIVGPTAIGKTSLSIAIANHFNCEIVSADSRQFFKEMNIGTAKPTSEELAAAPHHLVDCISVTENYSAGTFELDALKIIEELHQNNDIAVLIGGSGLYVDAVCKGIDDIPADPKIRAQLNDELEKFGLEKLQKELKELDPEHFEKMNTLNPQRVVRALEVCRATGKTYTSFRNNQPKERPFNIIKVGLNTDREVVYDRINRRVDIMMEQGQLEEVKSLLPYQHLNSLNTVGYKELFSHLNGEIELDEAIELMKKNTRNFAKRQLTWFRKDQNTAWFEPGMEADIIQHVEQEISRH